MFGAIANFLGVGKRADKVLDGAINGLDALVFTEEEKSVASQKVLDWKIEYAKVTANQSPARRAIALIVTAIWALLIVTAVASEGFGMTEFAEYCFKVLKENVNYSFLALIGFYFLPHIVKGK